MTTARFSLPLLQVGQAQKELTHNEAVQGLENAVQPVVDGSPVNAPPSAPEIGSQYLVGSAPEGSFAQYPNNLATWTAGGWRFLAPRRSMSAADATSGLCWTYDGIDWRAGVVRAAEIQVNGVKVLGEQQPAIVPPAAGSVIDQEARSTIAQVLSALRQHGIIAT